ncbi:hypothetical protein BDV26DRAFT_130126 [Aspergillus bertholletiae]|uniref:Cyanovirin-N domain-containing protein n=1 Tax=Aspergillus bertholletiae TaxID=1226010 RepID=A0A5N7AQW5_9EURO|nr:hypothetical protein BDV26DRAFT_130126 [Aspergillus bertholletiae]
MYWALLIIVPYLSALAVGGIPMAGSDATSRNNPKAETSKLHRYCTEWATMNPPRYLPSTSYPQPQSNSRSNRSPTLSPSLDRRADAPLPVLLVAACRMPAGGRRPLAINLDKCLGWDDNRKTFTAEYKYELPFRPGLYCFPSCRTYWLTISQRVWNCQRPMLELWVQKIPELP